MTGRTHAAAGLLLGSVIITTTALTGFFEPFEDSAHAVIAAGACVLGSLTPDIDCCTSKLGRKAAPASLALQLIFGHRTLFHSPILYAALYVLGMLIFPQWGIFITAAMIGVLTHLILDTLNPAGIPWLYPWKKKFHITKFLTGGVADLIIGFACLIGAGVILVRGTEVISRLSGIYNSVFH